MERLELGDLANLASAQDNPDDRVPTQALFGFAPSSGALSSARISEIQCISRNERAIQFRQKCEKRADEWRRTMPPWPT
jgi:hypothetical protein